MSDQWTSFAFETPDGDFVECRSAMEAEAGAAVHGNSEYYAFGYGNAIYQMPCRTPKISSIDVITDTDEDVPSDIDDPDLRDEWLSGLWVRVTCTVVVHLRFGDHTATVEGPQGAWNARVGQQPEAVYESFVADELAMVARRMADFGVTVSDLSSALR